MKRKLRAALVATFLAAAAVQVPAQDAVYTPAQVAFLNAQIKKAQSRFAQQASAISGVPAEKIVGWIPNPNDWRAADPKFAVIPALERERKVRLTDEQRQQIVAADREMKAAIEKARADAKKR